MGSTRFDQETSADRDKNANHKLSLDKRLDNCGGKLSYLT